MQTDKDQLNIFTSPKQYKSSYLKELNSRQIPKPKYSSTLQKYQTVQQPPQGQFVSTSMTSHNYQQSKRTKQLSSKEIYQLKTKVIRQQQNQPASEEQLQQSKLGDSSVYQTPVAEKIYDIILSNRKRVEYPSVYQIRKKSLGNLQFIHQVCEDRSNQYQQVRHMSSCSEPDLLNQMEAHTKQAQNVKEGNGRQLTQINEKEELNKDISNKETQEGLLKEIKFLSDTVNDLYNKLNESENLLAMEKASKVQQSKLSQECKQPNQIERDTGIKFQRIKQEIKQIKSERVQLVQLVMHQQLTNRKQFNEMGRLIEEAVLASNYWNKLTNEQKNY